MTIARILIARAFTLIELLVTIAIIAVLVALIFPALSKTKRRVQGATCLSNTRQMTIAWHAYAGDHQDKLAPNPDDGKMKPNYNWCSGQAGIGMQHEFDTDILSDTASAMLTPYLSKTVSLYRCPADRRTGRSQNTNGPVSSLVPAARSISMNHAIGTDPEAGGAAPVKGAWLDGEHNHTTEGAYRTYGSISDFTSPGPANTWLLIDESSYNLNDASFAVSMVGAFWLDFPGRYHGDSSGLSFVDGHSEYHKWLKPHKPTPSQNESLNPDWVWLRDRTSAKK